MAKWADYGVSEVKYNQGHVHIDKLKAHPDKGDSIGSPSVVSRQSVVDGIKKRITYITILRNESDGKWNKGQPIEIVEINKKEYLKTVRNNKEEDNLGDLPEF